MTGNINEISKDVQAYMRSVKTKTVECTMNDDFIMPDMFRCQGAFIRFSKMAECIGLKIQIT